MLRSGSRRALRIAAAAVIALAVVAGSGATALAIVRAPAVGTAQSDIRAGQVLLAKAKYLPPPPVGAPGSNLDAVGDSVMLASAPELRAVYPGMNIDAVVSRQMNSLPGIVQALKDSGPAAADPGRRARHERTDRPSDARPGARHARAGPPDGRHQRRGATQLGGRGQRHARRSSRATTRMSNSPTGTRRSRRTSRSSRTTRFIPDPPADASTPRLCTTRCHGSPRCRRTRRSRTSSRTEPPSPQASRAPHQAEPYSNVCDRCDNLLGVVLGGSVVWRRSPPRHRCLRRPPRRPLPPESRTRLRRASRPRPEPRCRRPRLPWSRARLRRQASPRPPRRARPWLRRESRQRQPAAAVFFALFGFGLTGSRTSSICTIDALSPLRKPSFVMRV